VNCIKTRKIDLLVVDEAHCISEWGGFLISNSPPPNLEMSQKIGHAFRPDYLMLKEITKQLEIDRVLCTTATATLNCAKDILDGFNIPKQNYFTCPFYRENL
jgi:ATP-dependent DNA helicase RecQ